MNGGTSTSSSGSSVTGTARLGNDPLVLPGTPGDSDLGMVGCGAAYGDWPLPWPDCGCCGTVGRGGTGCSTCCTGCGCGWCWCTGGGCWTCGTGCGCGLWF